MCLVHLWLRDLVELTVVRASSYNQKTMSFLAEVTCRGLWQHTHNAALNGEIIPLYAEPWQVGSPDETIDYLVLFERGASRPSWSLRVDGSGIKRLRHGPPYAAAGRGSEEEWDGVIVEVNWPPGDPPEFVEFDRLYKAVMTSDNSDPELQGRVREFARFLMDHRKLYESEMIMTMIRNARAHCKWAAIIVNF